MKKGKMVLIILGVCFVCFVAFVLADCVRISRMDMGAKPLITLSEEIPNGAGDLKYNGPGYSVVYKMDYVVKTGDADTDASYLKENAYGQEIWLFDKILLWGWVE